MSKSPIRPSACVSCHVSYVPEFDAQGQVAGFVAAITDISERKRTEEALRESEARFRTLAEALPQIIWVNAPASGPLEYVNTQWLTYTGLGYEENLANSNQAIHPDDLPEAKAKWQQASRTGQPYQVKLRLRRADGAYRWFLSRSVPLRNESGQVLRWFGTSTDIHEQVQEEQDTRFLAELGERIRLAEEAEKLLSEAPRLIGEHLQVAHCRFFEIDRAHQRAVVCHADAQSGPPCTGEFLLSDYSPSALADVEAGHSVVNRDVQTDPRTAAYYERSYRPRGERA